MKTHEINTWKRPSRIRPARIRALVALTLVLVLVTVADVYAQEPEVAWGVISLVDASGHRYTPFVELEPAIIRGMPLPFYICFRSPTSAARRHFELTGWAGTTVGDTAGRRYYRYQINLRHSSGSDGLAVDYVNPVYTVTYDPSRWTFYRVTTGPFTSVPAWPRTSPADLHIPLGPRPTPWDDISISTAYPPFPEPRVRTDFSNESPARLDPCVRDYYGSERPEEPNYVYGYAHFDGMWWGASGAHPVGYPPDQLVRFRSSSGETVTVSVAGFGDSVSVNGDFEYGFRLVNAATRPTLTSPGVIEYDKSTWHFEDVSIEDVLKRGAYSSGSPVLLRIPLIPLPLPLTQWDDKPHFPGMWGSDGRSALWSPGLRIDFGGSTDPGWYRSPITTRVPGAVLPRAPTVTLFEYTAVLKGSPRSGELKAGGIAWTCRGEVCTARFPEPTPNAATCSALARVVGPIVAYGNTQRKLERAQIDECNRMAGVTK